MPDFEAVPIELDVLVINKKLLLRDGFRQWEYRYDQLNDYSSPEPEAFDREEPGQQSGVILHWNLPRSLRKDDALVPNRWLVEMSEEGSGETLSWVLESDCPLFPGIDEAGLRGAQTEGSRYLLTEEMKKMWASSKDAYRRQASVETRGDVSFAYLGVPFLAGTWTERSQDPLFLTAASAGNVAFSQYVPHCRAVFSFRHVPEKGSAVYNYKVTGWYSAGDEETLRRRYVGQASRVIWDLDGDIPSPDPLQDVYTTKLLNVGVGNSTQQALEALILANLGPPDHDTAYLLSALFSDALDLLNRPDGESLVAEKQHMDTFTARKGGTQFIITKDGTSDKPLELTKDKVEWLAELNKTQAELDEALSELRGLQWDLQSVWWKKGHFPDFPPVPGHTAADFNRFFDTGNGDSLIVRTLERIALVNELYSKIPKQMRLQEGQMLKAIPQDRCWASRNPVLAILGVKPPKALKREDSPASVPSAEQVSWNQPWEPMFLEWRAAYAHVPMEEDRVKNWEFNGWDYALTDQAKPPAAGVQRYGGMTLLSSHGQINLAERVKDQIRVLLEKDPEKYAQLDSYVDQIAGWNLLTAELGGFNDGLAQIDHRVFRRPHDETVSYKGTTLRLADILGYTCEDPHPVYGIPKEYQGFADRVPLMDWDVLTPFCGMRSGQMYLEDLVLYDKFGRVLNLARSGEHSGPLFSKNFPLTRHQSVMPTRNLLPDVAYPVQLAPRFLQHTKLETGVGEVLGWIILNFPNSGLEVYEPSGEYLGLLHLDAEKGVPRWDAPYGDPEGARLRKMTGDSSYIGKFVQRMLSGNGKDLSAFLQSVDAALWTMKNSGDKEDNLSAFFGRPLVFVRTDLAHVYEQAPLQDQSWDATFSPPEQAYTGYELAVKLGSPSDTQDGLVGYTLDSPDPFYAVAGPDQKSDYIRVIGETPDDYIRLPGNKRPGTGIVMLMDPFRTVHAYTGILPVKEIEFPQEIAKKTLRQMNAEVYLGPFLSCRVPPDTEGSDEKADAAIRIQPVTQDPAGLRWLQKGQDGKTVQAYPLSYIRSNQKDQRAAFEIYEGVLRAKVDFTKDGSLKGT